MYKRKEEDEENRSPAVTEVGNVKTTWSNRTARAVGTNSRAFRGCRGGRGGKKVIETGTRPRKKLAREGVKTRHG